MVLKFLRQIGSPPESQLPRYERPVTPVEKQQITSFWRELTRLHADENSLLNSRVQMFLVFSSLLFAAFSQFRDDKFFGFRMIFCLGAVAFTIGSWIVLFRTARNLRWHSIVLSRLDPFLFPHQDMRPYETVRRYTGRAEPRALIPVATWLSFILPMFCTVIWLALLGWTLCTHHCTPCANEIQKPAQGRFMNTPTPTVGSRAFSL